MAELHVSRDDCESFVIEIDDPPDKTDDDNESFYSAQDIDDSPEKADGDDDSFYSAEDLSIDQGELFVDNALMHVAYEGSDDAGMDSLQGYSDYHKIGGNGEYGAQNGEVYDFFNHDSYSSGNERSPSKKEVFVLESRSPGVLTLEIESSSDSDIYDERVEARPPRSPSVKILSCKEDASLLANDAGLWDEEITVPDTASGASDAVVEFDGARQVIVIASEGEEGLEDATRKRRQSAQSDEAPIAGHMQSPYQKKMRKLREIADRANHRVDDVPMRVIDLR